MLLQSESLAAYIKGSQAGRPVGPWQHALTLAMAERCLLADSPLACLATFLIQLMPTCLGMLSHSGLGLHQSLVKKTAQDQAHSESNESHSSTQVSLSQLTPVCVKLTEPIATPSLLVHIREATHSLRALGAYNLREGGIHKWQFSGSRDSSAGQTP